jgi:hypothetical protein
MFNLVRSVSSHPILFTAVAALAVAACGGAPEGGTAEGSQIATTSDALSSPVLPSPTLAVPAGNQAVFAFDAIGVQIYTCSATATGYGWVFTGPEATLYKQNGNVAGKHYLGPTGPTWQYLDGSKVVGSKIAAFTADPTAIPELLLKAVSHDGDGRMSDVTYIQRLDTVGGLAPSTGCDASAVGNTARVDYTATYFFSEASDGDD